MPPDAAPLVLPEGSARERLEDFMDLLLSDGLRGVAAATVKQWVLELADCHAAQTVELCLRPYPVPGNTRKET